MNDIIDSLINGVKMMKNRTENKSIHTGQNIAKQKSGSDGMILPMTPGARESAAFFPKKDSKQIYKIVPVPTVRLWGTQRLAGLLHLEQKNQPYGEVILASAMDSLGNGGTSIDGQPFSEFYSEHRKDLFGLESEIFPLRVNLIDTSQPLSVQVHPDRRITEQFGLKQGVNEFWFVLEAEKDSTIEIGHKAKDIEQISKAIQDGSLEEFLQYVPVAVGDYFFLRPGTLHAIGKGILVYELTYNIDMTYRIYDYNRINEVTNSKRELHIDNALSVLSFPQEYSINSLPITYEDSQLNETVLIDEQDVFTVKRWKVKDGAIINVDSFYLCTVIEGDGWLNGEFVCQYDTWLIPLTCKEIYVKGEMTLIAATYR